ncbi:hypothetical protein T07_8912 [Trichinella nelsoni]|uniref:Uncharacterized protein n=1 Tax=Trichinella nelsoni TaxID=6336 RepID=A0A0V0REE2_9BILA|nr:hypothetical protein T07_8912 [Trichinella nelsoni]
MKVALEDNEWNATSDSQYDLMTANRTHHSDSQWDIGRFNLRMFIICASLHKLIDNLTTKTIRIVDVVEMLLPERYLLGCLITTMCTDKFCSDKMQLHQRDGDVCDR